MKVLITTLNAKYIHTSLSIRYLKYYVKNEFPNVEIEEYTINQNIDYIIGKIFKKDVDVIAFSCYIWNIDMILQISEALKLLKPNIKIILGGPEVSFDGKKLMEKYPFIDFVIYGEGEETFKELLRCIEDKNSYKMVQGLIYKDEEIHVNEPRLLIGDLDTIPSPFIENLDDYKNRIVYYESSRGCPFNCSFCLSSTIEGVRFFSIDRVKQDLKLLIKAGVKQVKFVDRTFNAKKDYALEIMNFIIDQNVKNINFHFEVTAHLLDDDMLEFLKEVPKGLFQFEIGVQTTNPMTLEAINRNTNLERLFSVVNRIKSYKNIHQHLDLIAGLPYENYNSFKKSFDDIYSLRPEKLQLGFLKLLKGSELRENEELYGYKFLDKAPYEILENNYIKYGEILKLKIIEDLVEKYANELYFEKSLNYIISNFFKSTFDFFESFAEYWEENHLDEEAHSRVKLYKILLEFCISKIGKYNNLFREIIKFDFIYNSKSPNIPEFLKSAGKEVSKQKKHEFLKNEYNLLKYIPEYKNIPTKKIINEIYIEKFSYDILKAIDKKHYPDKIDFKDTVVLFVYSSNELERCKYFEITEEFIKEE